MKYIVETKKNMKLASEALEQSVASNEFSVLHVHNLKEKLTNKGIAFNNECKVFEVCNPYKAAEVMSADMELNMALPCRISIWEEEGKRYIGMISPKAMLALLSDADELSSMAE